LRLYMSSESPRQGFFQRNIMLTPPEIRGISVHPKNGIGGQS
jgi:hypothetical protein